jgi:molybdate transport system ATP-binding protein
VLRAELAHELGELELRVALEVQRGCCLALAGPSGAGKTTVLRLIAGIAQPRSGRIQCDGDLWLDTARGIRRPAERRRCGYVFQHYALFPHLRAWRNVAYGMPRSGPDRREAALALLARFGLEGRAEARPAELSGGERQRVALARALAARPQALLLDEPLAALDASTRLGASRELAGILRAAGVPVLLVTHDFAEAALLGDEIAILEDGHVVQQGSATQLAERPRTPFVADFTGAVVLRGAARATGDGLTAVELDGGATVFASGSFSGAVAISVYPWEIVLHRHAARLEGSARNVLAARVTSITAVGERVRVGLDAGQPLIAEITGASARSLGLAEGSLVQASWKATATRLIQR